MDSARAATVRRASARYNFLAMLLPGIFVFWLLHDQYAHATPPAIAIAIVFASLAAGAVAWAIGSAYLSRPLIVTAIVAPIIVLFVATLSAAVCYHFSCALFDEYVAEQVLIPARALENILVAALVYFFGAAPGWLCTLSIASILVRKTARDSLRRGQ